MTPGEINALRAAIREDITAAGQRVAERQDRAVESIAAEFGQLRQELSARVDNLTRTVERHTEMLRAVQIGQNSISNWADRLDKDQAAIGQNYFSQQRVLDDLRRRVEQLEKRAS
jgi:predicted  nucleic acid-binding Zn-ribbon protein